MLGRRTLCRGEVWLVDLDPTRGHEQAGRRPCLIVSVDLFNQGPAGLVVVLPITTKATGIPSHVPLTPPEAGLRSKSFIKCEDVRSIAKERLSRRLGAIPPGRLTEVEYRLKVLLGL